MRYGLFAAFLLMTAPVLAADDGWIDMFNGKNLDGWKANEHQDSFAVKDGTIRVNGERGHLFYMDQEFDDFVFETDVKTTPGSNSGIYFHTAWQDEGWPATGHEIQVNISHTDPVKSGSLYNRVKLFDVPAKDNEWYKCQIRVEGNTLRVSINGKLLYEYVQPDDVKTQPMISSGRFALQAHDPKSVVYFRNLRVKPLNTDK